MKDKDQELIDAAIWLANKKHYVFVFPVAEDMVYFAKSDIVKQYWEEKGWISVKDRMPEQEQSVLCYAKGGRCFTARFRGKKTFLCFDYNDFVGAAEDVEFWRELPTPPITEG